MCQDSADRLGQVIGEQTGQVQELRQQLLLRGRELAELSREREQERERAEPVARELERVQHLLKEKEAFIQVPTLPSAHATLQHTLVI